MTRDLSGIPSLQPRVPPRVRPGETEHEDIEASGRCCLTLGRNGVLHPVLHGHCVGRVAEQYLTSRARLHVCEIHHAINLLPEQGP
jgi:hypothetical protein